MASAEGPAELVNESPVPCPAGNNRPFDGGAAASDGVVLSAPVPRQNLEPHKGNVITRTGYAAFLGLIDDMRHLIRETEIRGCSKDSFESL
jgi:hypothetical protein